jgi:hypothetical protein
MKLRLSILLLAAAALAAAPAAGQTIKSLGYNTTNGQIVYSGSNALTFTNALQFSTNARAATRTNLGGTTVGNSVFTATNAAAAAMAIELGTTNKVSFDTVSAKQSTGFSSATLNGIQWQNMYPSSNGLIGLYGSDAEGTTTFGINIGTMSGTTAEVALFNANRITFYEPLEFNNTTNAATTRTNLSLGAANNVTFSNITASGTLAVSNTATFSTNVSVAGSLTATGNATLNGSDNLMPNATTASSGSSLMTRQLSDDRYLGEFWHAWRMSAYNTTNIPVAVFKTAACVLYTNGQSAFYVEAFLDPSKYAGKTVRVLAYCRVDSTNGGNVQGVGQIRYLTNNAGGADPNFPLTLGGQGHGTFGVFTNFSTDVFPVATSTNQYLIFTSNVGTISNNATMIIASFGFNRASTNTTFTNNLYMQGVQVVVE